MKDPKEIVVCENCGSPLLNTFIFSGAEKLCLNCGASRDMFFGTRVPETKELKDLQKKIEEYFEPIAKNILSGGCMHRGCKKCEEEREHHINHATDEEKELHKKAFQLLKDAKGKFGV